MKKKILIIGSAYPLRGGLSAFNERLCKQFVDQGFDTKIYTFSLQYPKLLFPGVTQYSDEKKGLYDINIKVCINSINPFNWIKIGNEIKTLKPDIIIVKYWIPFMAPCFGTILRIAKKNKHSRVICIADNIIPHEKRLADKMLTKFFVKSVDSFITMSEQVSSDLKLNFNKPSKTIFHPLYDNFGDKLDKKEARTILGLNESDKIILFFGFIRDYKGLDLLLKAVSLKEVIEKKIKLLVAGEFYSNMQYYLDLIHQLKIEKNVILKNHFISDSKIKYYLSACDFIIQPYKKATQSGITPLAYHFEKPMLVTNVGGLADMVPDNIVGVVCPPHHEEISKGILKLYEMGEVFFLKNLIKEKRKYSWNFLVDSILY